MWSIWHTLTKIEQRVAFNDTADDVMYTVHWFDMVLPSIYVSVNQKHILHETNNQYAPEGKLANYYDLTVRWDKTGYLIHLQQ